MIGSHISIVDVIVVVAGGGVIVVSKVHIFTHVRTDWCERQQMVAGRVLMPVQRVLAVQLTVVTVVVVVGGGGGDEMVVVCVAQVMAVGGSLWRRRRLLVFGRGGRRQNAQINKTRKVAFDSVHINQAIVGVVLVKAASG